MTPKTINLSYTAEDGTTHSREYTDLGQVWHPAEETPDKEQLIWYRKKDGQFNTRWTGIDGDIEWLFFADYAGVDCWAYIDDLLPAGKLSGNAEQLIEKIE